MVEIPFFNTVVKGVVSAAGYILGQREAKQANEFLDDLRRTSYSMKSNCRKYPIGSKEDRLCQKLVMQGRLKSTPLGYMLPEYYNG